MKHQIAIAVSGGIDSLVSAYLLKEQGFNVIGIHFVTGYETQVHCPGPSGSTALKNPDLDPLSNIKKQALHTISHIKNQLGIRVEIVDCSMEFQREVVDYFIRTYQAGQTPNPCMVCNTSIKFGTVLAYARKKGAFRLATGHYAKIIENDKDGFHLCKGIDQEKDQSYFLARLNQKQLAGACFPLGHMTKSEVKKLAAEKELYPAIEKESHDICFIKSKTYGEFLALQPGFKPRPGRIEDVNGKVLGEHKGLHLYTVGQRRGINCPSFEPYYVVNLDRAQNRLVVGAKKNLLSAECKVANISWINREPTSPMKVHTRIRYRNKGIESDLFPVGKHAAIIKFTSPQSAITPGQGAVFYKDDEVLGGGWIEK